MDCYTIGEICRKEKPQRVREYLNRTITTPLWDKTRTALYSATDLPLKKMVHCPVRIGMERNSNNVQSGFTDDGEKQ